MRYYKLDTKEIIDTKNEIPTEFWVKKNILPVITEFPKYEEGSNPVEDDGLYIESDKIREVRNKFYHVDTLEERKNKKINQLRFYIEDKFPRIEEQLSAVVSGIYPIEKENKIKESVIYWNKYIDDLKIEINLLTNVEDINSFEFRIPEDIE